MIGNDENMRTFTTDARYKSTVLKIAEFGVDHLYKRRVPNRA